MDSEYVIMGGGVAGLCAAIRLTELGIRPIVIEAGDYPSHKVCGEFFSPDCLEILKKWNISPLEIHKARFHSSHETLNFSFPKNAGGLSHFECDPQLVDRAVLGGAIIHKNTKVLQLTPESSKYELKLSNGMTLRASNLIIATGRIPNISSQSVIEYVGIKAHFTGIPIENSLEMFTFNGAYLGISPIENGKYNVACLAKIDNIKGLTPETFIDQLKSQNKLLESCLSHGTCLFSKWMDASLPAFGIKKVPNWPNVYFIGDAAGTIPPITGNGLSMAIGGGMMAAEFAVAKDSNGFKKAWRKKFASSIFWGIFLHQLMLNPKLGRRLIKIGQYFPFLAKGTFYLTR